MILKKSFVLLTLLCLSACSLFQTYVSTEVTRFYTQEVMSPRQTFALIEQPQQKNNLEYQKYASLVKRNLAKRGWTVAPRAEAQYYVTFSYGTDAPVNTIFKNTTPAYQTVEVESAGGNSSAEPTYVNLKSDETTFYNGISYTYHFDMEIADKNNRNVFEGHASSRGSSVNFNKISKCMIDSLLEDFPGLNGYTATVKKTAEECTGPERPFPAAF